MATMDFLINSITTLLVTTDPPGLAPIFLGMTAGMSTSQRRQVALRGVIIAFFILAFFAIAGASVLTQLGISMGAFRVAGGLLLFWIAFEMIFEKRQQRHENTKEVALTKDQIHDLAAFPLGIPLIAGPGAISATILLSGSLDGPLQKAGLVTVIAFCLAVMLAALMVAERLDRFLGMTGRAILTRLLGVLLAALSVQFVIDGVKSAFS
ncbi:MarC family protein [Rhizobium sp. NRK18]|uniref:MarC family protein n=1 Tax=Rhizobium sp. NRK18 TaxID=2964667 RepID=UPI0021C3C154|nr:MarC family protein [Rhizobium sp. NRK18]MCQ2004177.1 MarC family protein [Rhizobium sp. NRK18]